MPSPKSRLVSTLAALLGSASLFPVQALPDRILIFDSSHYSQADLPDGAGSEPASLPAGIYDVLPLPSGRQLALTLGPAPERRIVLNELTPQRTLVPLGLLPPPDFAFESDRPASAAVDSRGRVYFLLRSLAAGNLGTRRRLVEVDPVTGATVRVQNLDSWVYAIATAPQGLWALSDNTLHRLDPDTGHLGPVVRQMPGVGANTIEADSAGRLWFIDGGGCIPESYCHSLHWLDPETGSTGEAPMAMWLEAPSLLDIAIVRRCADSATTRCLRGGRFLAEIEFAAYDGVSGAAQAAPARSADTATFSFFDPDNWELMVKVLDGCAINSKFWVYSSASTDVQYTMTITDTETGAQKVYTNPLGRIALTVTDNQAFSCTN